VEETVGLGSSGARAWRRDPGGHVARLGRATRRPRPPAGAALAPTGRPGPAAMRGLAMSRVHTPCLVRVSGTCLRGNARGLMQVSDTPDTGSRQARPCPGVSDTYCLHLRPPSPTARPRACRCRESWPGLGGAGRPVGARAAPAGGRGRLGARPSRATWPARTAQPRPGRPTNTALRTKRTIPHEPRHETIPPHPLPPR